MKGHLAKKDGSKNYYVVLDVYDDQGKRKRKWVSTRTHLKKEAEIFRIDLIAKANDGELPVKKELKLNRFLEDWKEIHAKPHMKASTYKKVEWLLKKIPSTITMKELSRINPMEIQRFLNDLTLSKTTKRDIYDILNQALNQAISWGYLKINPCSKIDPPKKAQPKKTVLTPEELTLLIDCSKNTESYIPILLVASTGIRRGELCALKWENIDFTTNIMRINQSLDVLDGEVIVSSTKTASGLRGIKLPAFLVEELKEYQNKLSQRLNRKISPTDYVLIGKNGSNRNPDSVYRGMKRIIENKNLPISTTLHGLRHSHATMLLLEGVPVKVITERLGHASTKITQDIYMHVLPEMQDKAADVMDSILKPKSKPNGRRMVEVKKK